MNLGHISHEKSFEYIEIIFPKSKFGQKNRQYKSASVT
jgi:hypothetical protein